MIVEMPQPLRIVVCAPKGRMGSQVADLAEGDPRFVVAARAGRELSGEALLEALKDSDAAVDFSTPEAGVAFAAAAARAGCAFVCGTTGFTPSQRARLKAAARKVPVFLAPNFSIGVAVLYRAAALAARALKGYDAGIVETHHAAKRDAPSGTALRLAEAVKEARGDGREVPAVSQRLGTVIGEHTLTLAGPFERLELTHRAQSRALFAGGALEAALWLRGRKPGLYGMEDLVGA